ncbi:retrovirus-related pol polyprotein from transposon TNT 1-94 [Tanacetum coccineum]
MELYMQNREHGRMILESVEHGPLIWPTIEENGVTRTKKYEELSATEKIQADCDLKATNIILQGLPSDVYSLVNHHRVAKDLWERVQLLMQDSGLAVPVFKQGNDPIDPINKMMSFLSTVVSSRFPTTNNQKLFQPQDNKKLFMMEGNNSGQQRVVKCFNCQGEGHIARQYPKPKRKRDATWFRDKVLLVEAQGSGKVLNEEELEFLADPRVAEGPVTQTVITHNTAYQAHDLDAYDSDCDDFFTAKAVLMANLSSYGSDVLFEVPHSENTHTDMLNQSVQEMSYSEQTHLVNYPENEITNQSKEKELLTKTFNVFKNESKENEAKNIDKEIALEKKKARQIRPMLYDGSVIAKETNVISIANSEETLMLEEESRSKMILKQSDPVVLEKKVNIKPINYAELNRLSEDFGMYKLNPVTLAPKDKNNRETHIYYLKHTMKQAAILNEIVEQAKSLNPLDSASYSASKSKSIDNTKNDMILQISSSTKKKNAVKDHSRIVKSSLNKSNYVVEPSGNENVQHSKLNTNSKLMFVKCNSSMFDARHELCFLEFVSDMNASSKSKSVKKAKKKEEWKPTGKVFTKIGYNRRPTRRTFTLVGNACPLTRITATNKVPLREPIPLEVVAQESIVTKVYTRRPKVPKANGSNTKPKIAKSMISNKMKLGTSPGSNTSVAPSSSSVDLRLSKLFYGIWSLDAQST